MPFTPTEQKQKAIDITDIPKLGTTAEDSNGSRADDEEGMIDGMPVYKSNEFIE